MGVVYKATDIRLGRSVALKSLLKVSPMDCSLLCRPQGFASPIRTTGKVLCLQTHSVCSPFPARTQYEYRPVLHDRGEPAGPSRRVGADQEDPEQQPGYHD